VRVSLTGLEGAAEEDAVGASRGAGRELVESDALAAGLGDARTGTSGEAVMSAMTSHSGCTGGRRRSS
jgi:hypothetical protein